MKKDSFMYFKSGDKYLNFFQNLDIYNGWKIQSGKMNDRGRIVKNSSYMKYLVKLFDEKDLFYKKLSIAEAVSFLDNYILVQRLIELLKSQVDEQVFSKIEFFMEYEIKMSKRMRIDYIIKYKEKKLLLEFRLVNSFNKLRSTWQRKKQELLIYKELMSNYIETPTNIITYAFIFLYEYKSRKLIDKHHNYNNNQVKYLLKYILEFLIYDIDYSF